jgi:hypothetical protein
MQNGRIKKIKVISFLNRVRDAFLLQCHKGLCYGCLLCINENFIKLKNGRKWIEKPKKNWRNCGGSSPT